MPDKEQSDSNAQDAQQALSPRRVERIELCGSLAGIHRVHPESPSLGLQSQIQSLLMGRDKSVTRGAAYRAEEAKWRIEEASFGHALYLVAEELRARVEGAGASEEVTSV